MFYSHQLLARKAPLGQIWMAATMHAKINRKNLDKLNLIRICEEILNPSIPMALRLSGILMGGVVIVYERKVKLLYDDVHRLLVEINQAWKIKAVPEPTSTSASKSKTRAKREAISRRENEEEDLGEIEQPLHHSNSMSFAQTTYFAMGLDKLEDHVTVQDHLQDIPQDHHQADADNITLFDSYQPDDTNMHNHFERFDIEGDDDTQLNFTSQENMGIPNTVIPSPPAQERPQEPDEILEQHPEVPVNQESDQSNKREHIRQGPNRKRTRRQTMLALDYEETIIPGHIYQSWLQNTSDIISRRKRRKHLDSMATVKIPNLMELPPVVVTERLFKNGTGEIYYPAQILELWMRSTQPPHDSPSGRSSTPLPPAASSSSPVAQVNGQDPFENPFEVFQNGDGSHLRGLSIEKLRSNFTNNYAPPGILLEDLINNNQRIEVTVPEANGFNSRSKSNMMTPPGNTGDELRSIPSSGSGYGFLSHNSDPDSGRSNKKRPYSSSKHSGSGLEPVAEENSWKHQDSVFKLAKLAEYGLTPENELLVETGPTQTQRHPIIPQPMDNITYSIRMQLKAHFDTPGCPQAESLNQLTYGMDRKQAACLFYTTCVLATQDCIRVAQNQAYGDILISRGSKM